MTVRRVVVMCLTVLGDAVFNAVTSPANEVQRCATRRW